MKVKTSITLSEHLLRDLDRVGEGQGNRSRLIEEAIRLFLQFKMRALREKQDLAILNKKAGGLNKEAADVLLYQEES